MNDVLYKINREIPYEESGLNLEPDEIEWYNKSIEELREERKKHPGVPLGYGPVELEWE